MVSRVKEKVLVSIDMVSGVKEKVLVSIDMVSKGEGKGVG